MPNYEKQGILVFQMLMVCLFLKIWNLENVNTYPFSLIKSRIHWDPSRTLKDGGKKILAFTDKIIIKLDGYFDMWLYWAFYDSTLVYGLTFWGTGNAEWWLTYHTRACPNNIQHIRQKLEGTEHCKATSLLQPCHVAIQIKFFLHLRNEWWCGERPEV